MNYIWRLIGKVLYWLSWPIQFVYLRIGSRTRVVLVAEGQVLCLQGWIGDGKWGLPGGGVHHGEDVRAGAVREVFEETGVMLKPTQLQQLGKAKSREHGLSFSYTQFYVELATKPVLKLRQLEIAEVRWLDPEEALRRPLSRNARQTIKAWSQK